MYSRQVTKTDEDEAEEPDPRGERLPRRSRAHVGTPETRLRGVGISAAVVAPQAFVWTAAVRSPGESSRLTLTEFVTVAVKG